MRDRIIIKLPSSPTIDTLEWLSIPAPGNTENIASQSGTLEECQNQCRGKQVVALIPTEQTLLTSHRLPAKQHKQIAAAIPYALENQIATEVENMHFATEVPDRLGNIHVAVIEHAQMRQTLDQLRAHGIHPDELTPGVLSLPITENTWTMASDGNVMIVRTGTYSGFSCDVSNLDTILSAQATQNANGNSSDMPQNILYVRHGGDLTGLEAFPSNTDHYNIEQQNTKKGLLQVLADGMDTRRINLMQGPYSRHATSSKLWSAFRPAAILLVTYILIQFGSSLVTLNRLDEQYQSTQKQIDTAWLQLFPGKPIPKNPRQQLEKALSQLEKTQPGKTITFMQLISAIAGPVGQNGNTQIIQVSYQNSSLELTLSTQSLQTLDALKQKLSDLPGIDSRLRTAQSSNGSVEARLTIGATSK